MLIDPLFAHAARQPETLAIIDDSGRYTYRQIAGMAAGFAKPQAEAIEAYSFSQSGVDQAGERRLLDPCATSWMGDGLFGLTQQLRRGLHEEAGTQGCVAPEAQVAFAGMVAEPAGYMAIGRASR